MVNIEIFIKQETIMKKVLLLLTTLFITMSGIAKEQGTYDITTEDFILYPNYETGELKIRTHPFNDVMDVSILKDGETVNKYNQHVKTSLITLDFQDVKNNTFILVIRSGKKKILYKHILIEPKC